MGQANIGPEFARLVIGGWFQSGAISTFAGGSLDGTAGFYALFDLLIFGAPGGADSGGFGMKAFLQYGFADPAVSEIDHHVALGLVWHQRFIGSGEVGDSEQIGLYATMIHLAPGAGFASDIELAIEIFIRLEPTPWLALKPNVQLIINPGANGNATALVVTLRAELLF